MRRPVVQALVLLAAGAVCGALPSRAGGGEPGTPSALLLADVDSPRARGIRAAFERVLGETGIRPVPVPAPWSLGGDLASAFDALAAGSRRREERAFLLREMEERGAEGVLLLSAREAAGRIACSVWGGVRPFDRIWRAESPPVPAGSFEGAFRALADSAAVRFGAERAVPPFVALSSLEGEEIHARAMETGSVDLFLEASGAHGHQAARSELGFRLLLRGSRERGLAFLEDVNDTLMNRFEREAHRARLTFRSGGEGVRAAVGALDALFPGRFETLLLGGAERLRAGELSEARDRLEQAILLRPGDPLPRLLLAEAALRDGYLNAAGEACRRALVLDPHDFLGPIGLASVLYSDGLLQEAEELLARPPLIDPHAAEGTRPYFLHQAARANLQFAGGRFFNARRTLALARNEAFRLGDEESLVDLTIRRFYVFLEEGAVDSAAVELSELRFRERAPLLHAEGDALVPYLEGLLGAHRGDYGTVTAKRLELETIAGTDPSLADLIEGTYEVLRGSGGEASLPLRRALRGGESRMARHLLGRASLERGRWGEAIERLEWIVDRGEPLLDLPLLLPSSFFYLGRAFEERGDRAEAELAFREFLHYWRHADSRRAEIAHAAGYLVHGPGKTARPD
ncbi:MAG: hypothetical protein ABIH26_08475 [Candidatus Eisenbacteria bacterium]